MIVIIRQGACDKCVSEANKGALNKDTNDNAISHSNSNTNYNNIIVR